MSDTFEYFMPPQEIERGTDWDAFASQSEHPRGIGTAGLALCDFWHVAVNGREVPVLATPVTFDSPHCFCLLRLKGEPLELTVQRVGAKTLQISALHQPTETQKGDACSCMVREPCSLTIEADGMPHRALSIHISPAEEAPTGKVLRFGPGIHCIDTVELQDDSTIYLENGAILRPNLPAATEQPLLESDWAGVPEYCDFLRANSRKNLKICGMGIIDTTCLPWHARRTVFLNNCENVHIEGVTLTGTAHWTVVPYHCKNVTIRDVKIFGHRENSDGIDLVNCENVRVSDCYIRTGDDAICLKGMLPPEVMGGRAVEVRNNTIWTEKARSLGVIGETRGDFEDILFCDCLILHGRANWTRELGALCIVLSDGGTVQNVTFRDIAILQEDSWVIDCMIKPDFWSTDQKPGHIRDVRFTNICVLAVARINLEGFDKDHQVEALLIQIESPAGPLRLQLERNPYTQNCQICL